MNHCTTLNEEIWQYHVSLHFSCGRDSAFGSMTDVWKGSPDNGKGGFMWLKVTCALRYMRQFCKVIISLEADILGVLAARIRFQRDLDRLLW